MGVQQPMRAVIVDDDEDVRGLLKRALERRGGFEVVGEAVNGLDGVAVVADTQPDLVILDRDMPVAGGIEVLPDLRRRCPTALIVLYTAQTGEGVRGAAIAAGADEVRHKLGEPVTTLVDDLAGLLLARREEAEESHAAPDDVQLQLGPVDADVARRWIENTKRLFDALRSHPEEIPPGVTVELLDLFDSFLTSWATVAEGGGEFRWTASASPRTVERLVSGWAEIDRLSDDAMARLGCTWSGPDARPFFDELTRAVIAAMAQADELASVRASLPPDWSADPPTGRAGAG